MQISRINSTSFNGLFKRKAKPELTDEQKLYHKQGVKKGATMALAGVVGVSSAVGGGYYLTQDIFAPQAIVIPYDNNGTHLDEIENVLEVDGRTFELLEGNKVSVPVSFDYIQEKIDSERDKMFSYFASENDQQKSYQTIAKLMEKQAYQKTIASACKQDDGRIRFTLTLDNDDEITVEEFKRIFDIKDGALSAIEENSVGIVWGASEKYEGSDNGILPKGIVFVVEENDINTNNINFDY